MKQQENKISQAQSRNDAIGPEAHVSSYGGTAIFVAVSTFLSLYCTVHRRSNCLFVCGGSKYRQISNQLRGGEGSDRLAAIIERTQMEYSSVLHSGI